MNLLKTAIAIVMLALWVPVTSHCLLEVAGLMPEALHCADPCQEEDSSHKQTDSCSTLESALYKSNERPVSVASAPLVILVWLAADLDRAAPPPTLHSPVRPDFPAELQVTWQFNCRAALPVRAPSIAS